MIRLEIVANHSVEEDLLEAFKDAGVGKFYTRYDNVSGVGTSGPRMGDAIWPEVNFSLIIWCELDEARGIAKAVAGVKKHFPDEGIKLFGLPDPNAPPPVVVVAASPAEMAGRAVSGPVAAPGPQEPPKPVRPPDFGGENF
ncbi:hypothetical protein FACS1894130_08850 [Spirochaetia bacterium]|nr:hypothetical protein FACS1894130_08850 [Spirochaetia bacterium]